MDSDSITLYGPIEREGRSLVLRIPLDAGGEQLHLVCDGFSEIDGDDLVIHISDELGAKMHLGEGTQVCVDDKGGRFNIGKAPVE